MTALEMESTQPEKDELNIEQALEHLEASLHSLEEQLARLEQRIAAAELDDDVRRRVEMRIERARRRGEAAMQRLRRRLLSRRRRAGHYREAREVEVDLRQAEPSDTDEERVMILQMLQDGKITPEQAEMLLDALEGGQR